MIMATLMLSEEHQKGHTDYQLGAKPHFLSVAHV